MKTIAMQQLDKTLAGMKSALGVRPPARGWLRAIRDAIGMSGPQLARRMGVSKQRISELEGFEVNGSATLKSMRQAAETLDCVLVYALVPRDSLQAMVEQQARKLAVQQSDYAAHTMRLEDQLPNAEERQAALDAVVAELVRTMPKNLWD